MLESGVRRKTVWGPVFGREIGGVAQLGERLVCNQEVIGSIPFTSTSIEITGQSLQSLAEGSCPGGGALEPSATIR